MFHVYTLLTIVTFHTVQYVDNNGAMKRLYFDYFSEDRKDDSFYVRHVLFKLFEEEEVMKQFRTIVVNLHYFVIDGDPLTTNE